MKSRIWVFTGMAWAVLLLLPAYANADSAAPQCVRAVAEGIYRVACTRADGDGHDVWVMPGKTHVLLLLAGKPETLSDWPALIRQQWPDKQIQILDMQSDCWQLHANQRLVEQLSLPLGRSADGLAYSMGVLASRSQFAQFKGNCRSMTGVVFPGGGIKARSGSLATILDVDSGWNYQLQTDNSGAWQMLVYNPQERVMLTPRFLGLAAGQPEDSSHAFNWFAYWVGMQQREQYKIFSNRGEVSVDQSQARLSTAVQSQLAHALLIAGDAPQVKSSPVLVQAPVSVTPSH